MHYIGGKCPCELFSVEHLGDAVFTCEPTCMCTPKWWAWHGPHVWRACKGPIPTHRNFFWVVIQPPQDPEPHCTTDHLSFPELLPTGHNSPSINQTTVFEKKKGVISCIDNRQIIVGDGKMIQYNIHWQSNPWLKTLTFCCHCNSATFPLLNASSKQLGRTSTLSLLTYYGHIDADHFETHIVFEGHLAWWNSTLREILVLPTFGFWPHHWYLNYSLYKHFHMTLGVHDFFFFFCNSVHF